MARPGGQQLIVHGHGLLRRFVAGGVVGHGVKFLRALGRRYQMKHRVIAVPQLQFVGPHIGQHLGKLLLGHVSAVIHGSTVAHNQNFARVHGMGRLHKQAFLFHLQLHLAFLIIQVGAAGPGSHAAGNQLGSGFRHKQHRIAPLGKGVLNPAEGGGFARAGAAGNHNFMNLFHLKRFSFRGYGNKKAVRYSIPHPWPAVQWANGKKRCFSLQKRHDCYCTSTSSVPALCIQSRTAWLS